MRQTCTHRTSSIALDAVVTSVVGQDGEQVEVVVALEEAVVEASRTAVHRRIPALPAQQTHSSWKEGSIADYTKIELHFKTEFVAGT
jgi:hypothetical protein